MYSHFNLVLQGFVFVMSYCFILCFACIPLYSWGGLLFQKSVLAVQFPSLLQHLIVDIDGFWQQTKMTCSLLVMRLSVN